MLIPIPKFDAQEWFSQFTEAGHTIAQDELQPVLEFTLIWNLFERQLFRRSANLGEIRRHMERALDLGRINPESYKPHIAFFRERYDNPTEEFLMQVLLSSSKQPSEHDLVNIGLVKSAISGEFSDPNNVIYALLFIAYRVRNNLFQGEKNVHTLHLQKELFETVNSYLSIYMSETLELKREGGS